MMITRDDEATKSGRVAQGDITQTTDGVNWKKREHGNGFVKTT
jgi:hypothetical protein